MRPLLLRAAGFSLLPLLVLVLPFLLLPNIARLVDTGQWPSTTSGRAIGNFASALILGCLNISGLAWLARTSTTPDRAVRVFMRRAIPDFVGGSLPAPRAADGGSRGA